MLKPHPVGHALRTPPASAAGFFVIDYSDGYHPAVLAQTLPLIISQSHPPILGGDPPPIIGNTLGCFELQVYWEFWVFDKER